MQAAMFGERTPLRLTTADLVVLSVLMHRGAMHGYDLVQTLEGADVQDWAAVSRPQVYYSLKKLERAGYLQAVDDKTPAQGPERIVYKTTRKAAPAMRKALAKPDWMKKRPPSPFVTWGALALSADPKTVAAQIARRADFLKSEIVREQETLKDLSQYEGRDVAVARVLVEMAIDQIRGELGQLGALETALME